MGSVGFHENTRSQLEVTGEWSTCDETTNKRKRTRLCVGLKALLTDCSCQGPNIDEKTCSSDVSRNDKPASTSGNDLKQPTKTTDDKQIIDKAQAASRQFDSPLVRRPPDETAAMELVEFAKNCEYLEWTPWGDCSSACDTNDGTRRRTRACPCRCVHLVSIGDRT